MTRLSDNLLGAIHGEDRKQTKTQTQTTKETEISDGSDTLDIPGTTEITYEDYKKRWENRKINESIQPYVNHIELFLALIEPEYNAEVQFSEANSILNSTAITERFTVTNSNVKFNWQLTDDRGEVLNGAKSSNPFAIKALYGTLEDHYNTINFKNRKGANPCIAINKLSGSIRKNEAVTSIRAIWLEDDVQKGRPRTAADIDDPLPLPPSFIVESSNGKFHYYWLTTTEDLGIWQRLQKEVMSEKYGSDFGANGLNRAMRIPGFWHSKKKGFPTRIVYLLGSDNLPIEAKPSTEFLAFAKDHPQAREEYAYEPYLASQVRRYDWEEILETFGKFLPEKSVGHDYNLSTFDPIEAMERIFVTEDYHASLHALCMHFANFVQDPEYVTAIVQSLLTRVPERQRDIRWNSRFNDIPRSASAAVIKKLEEQALTTTLSEEIKENDQFREIELYDEDWPLAFPDLTGLKPFDDIMDTFGSGSGSPIKSFNFAAAISFITLILQNIPVMPLRGFRHANGCHLLLAPSTEGKDINTTVPLKSLVRALERYNLKLGGSHDVAFANIIGGLDTTSPEISSLSAFHNWASLKEKGGLWVNTECTSLMGKMADNNENISNLAKVVISVQDGESISAVIKSATKEDKLTAIHEGYTLLFAAQPGTIKKHMTPELMQKGVIGRFDYYIPDVVPSTTKLSTFDREVSKPIIWDDKLLDFLLWAIKQCNQRTENDPDGTKREVLLYFDKEDKENKDGPMRTQFKKWDLDWQDSDVFEIDQQFSTFIARIQMSVERWATIFTTFKHLWDCYNDKKRVPFTDDLYFDSQAAKMAQALGDYQYDVRFSRIQPLVGSSKGLDNDHMDILNALRKADKKPSLWLRQMSAKQSPVYRQVHEKEMYLPMHSILSCIDRSATIQTRDYRNIIESLAALGYVEFVKLKQVDARLSSKPLKNLVRLTASGRM